MTVSIFLNYAGSIEKFKGDKYDFVFYSTFHKVWVNVFYFSGSLKTDILRNERGYFLWLQAAILIL